MKYFIYPIYGLSSLTCECANKLKCQVERRVALTYRHRGGGRGCQPFLKATKRFCSSLSYAYAFRGLINDFDYPT